jgi:hypothetical protein
MSREAFVIGVGMTRFEKPGSREWDHPDMARESGSNAIGASGMVRFAESALQVRGVAGEHQVEAARKALGHAHGGGSQFFSMWIMGSEPL